MPRIYRVFRTGIESLALRTSSGMTEGFSFIAPLRQMHRFEMQLFAMEFRRLIVALKLPCEYGRMVFVVADGFAVGRLMFFAKMRSSRFVALQRVNAH